MLRSSLEKGQFITENITTKTVTLSYNLPSIHHFLFALLSLLILPPVALFLFSFPLLLFLSLKAPHCTSHTPVGLHPARTAGSELSRPAWRPALR